MDPRASLENAAAFPGSLFYSGRMTEAETLQQTGRTQVWHHGRKLDYFAGCDYFRLARRPEVWRAAERAGRLLGWNVAASRRTTGNHVLYQTLERELAEFFHAPAAVLLPTGYTADLAVAQALAGQFTLALMDERAHGSLAAAARCLDCPVKTFRHRQPAELARALRRCGPRGRVIVLTDGMFSADGSVAPLAEYLAVLAENAIILVDDAHAAGVLGRHGRGTPEHTGAGRRRIIQTITLSKALGAYGGAVLASRAVCDKIMTASHCFAGATPVPLPLAAAARAGLKLLAAHPEWRTRLWANTERVKAALRAHAVPLPDAPGPIVPLPVTSPRAAARWRRALLAAGVYPSFFRYPGGPAGGCFRFVISSEHSRRQLDRLIEVVTTTLREG
jgi:7-keto-8-aminopelargonate synthetase-like enzyme